MTSFVITEQRHVTQVYWLPYHGLKRFTESEFFTSSEIAKLDTVTVLNRRLIALYLISFTAIQTTLKP